MFLGILTMLTALSISAVAIYYSVAGLVAIFAGAAVPIIIMGSVLEVAKLVAAIWLHYYWDLAVWWLKTYLVASIVILMVITSMGIFGFLSKAHIDQTAGATEGLARLEQLDTQIKRQETIVFEAQQEINKLESSGVNRDAEVQAQIDKEQVRIDSAYTRTQPAIDEQNDIIAKEEQRLGGGASLYKNQLDEIDRNLKNIEDYITVDNVKAVQALIGVEADGNLGPATARAIEAYRVAQTAEKQRLVELIAQESSNISSTTIDAARAEIQRLRGLAEQEIANSNELINRLRQQLGTTDTDQVFDKVAKQNAIIEKTEQEIAALSEQKFGLESEYRKLEAEVGPIKYLAEFVYGNSGDKDLLEEAVRWVIILIIFVFDPLAVLLLVASQQTFKFHDELRKKESLRSVVDNSMDVNYAAPNRSDKKTKPRKTRNKRTPTNETSTDNTVVNSATDEVDQPLPETKLENGELLDDRPIPTANTDADESLGEIRTGDIVSVTTENDSELESTEISTDEYRKKRLDRLNVIESRPENKLAKIQWKQDHPESTIKEFKEAYINGDIDRLPWENYVQNGEQNPNSLWNKIRPNNE
jgi:hypothetical protein